MNAISFKWTESLRTIQYYTRITSIRFFVTEIFFNSNMFVSFLHCNFNHLITNFSILKFYLFAFIKSDNSNIIDYLAHT